MNALSENVKITKVKAASVAGQTAVNSDPVDMQLYEGVLFFVTALAITTGGVQSINAAQDDASNGSFTDLANTKVVIADDDDNQTFWIDVFQPQKRFVRLEIARATQDSAFGEIYSIQYGVKKAPVTNNVADTITGELHTAPAEGTA